jgi:hypothetical protein
MPRFPVAARDPRPIRQRALIALHAVLLFAAFLSPAPLIAADGDLGRHKPSWWTDTFLPALGKPLAAGRGEPVSGFNLTDEEKILRDLSYALIDPPHERQVWERIVAIHARARTVPNDTGGRDREGCFRALSDSPYRSTAARYARLVDDIEADRARIAPFFTTAERVRVLDDARERALSAIERVTTDEQADAMARIAENLMLVGWVHRRLGERVVCYRYALERLAISEPSPAVASGERALARLEQAIALIRRIDSDAPRRPVATGPREPWHPTTDEPQYRK